MTFRPKAVKVFAPGSIANIAAGFDVLGLALEAPGDIVMASRRQQPGLHFHLHKGSVPLPAGNQNVAAHVAALMLEELKLPFGIELTLHKKMPIGSGLGSSGASSAAAAFAVNQLLAKPLAREDLLAFAAEGERLASGSAHADNIAPSLLGGLCLIRSYQPLDVVKLSVRNRFYWVVVHPHMVIATEKARKLLPASLPLKTVTRQLGSLGGLLIALTDGDAGLLRKSLVDHIAEPVRAQLIPGFMAIKESVLAAGALGFSISGSGPSVFAVTTSLQSAQQMANIIKQGFKKHAGLKSDCYISRINQRGASKIG